MKRILLLPLGLFIALVGFLLIGLHRDPHEVPSPLINNQLPLSNCRSFTIQRKHLVPRTCAEKFGCSISGEHGASPAAKSIRCWLNTQSRTPFQFMELIISTRTTTVTSVPRLRNSW